jgi:enoyl-CoA hydratase
LEEVSFDNEIRVVIVTGAGEGFCAGADLEDPGWLDIFNGLTVPGIARRAMKVLDDVIKTIHDMHQPVIGAINGAAIGGGFCLAMATDIRIASEKAYFRPAGINNGLTSAELGLSYLLPRAIGTSRAFEIMLTGRDVDALEAADLGIVSRTVHPDQLLDECYAIAERICGFSQLGVELSKQMLWAGVDAGSLHTHMNHEGHAQLFVRMTTENFEEAIRARKEGRRPDYKD